MKQTALAANHVEKFEEIAKEKALLEIKYMKKEKDTNLVSLNVYRKPAT